MDDLVNPRAEPVEPDMLKAGEEQLCIAVLPFVHWDACGDVTAELEAYEDSGEAQASSAGASVVCGCGSMSSRRSHGRTRLCDLVANCFWRRMVFRFRKTDGS